MLKPPLSRVPPGLSHVSTAGASEPVGAAARVDSHGSAVWPRRLGEVRSGRARGGLGRVLAAGEPTSRELPWTFGHPRPPGRFLRPRHFHSIAVGGLVSS